MNNLFDEFEKSLAGREPKTISSYRSAFNGLVNWLTTKPGGQPFHISLLTENAIQSYLDWLASQGYAPRTRSKILTALRRFCRWAVAEGKLSRDPTQFIERPVVVSMAPRELTDGQRYVLKELVERTESRRIAAIFALGYWAALRVSEVSSLELTHCEVNQRAGVIIIQDSKGGKTRTLDLHNHARRALYDYLQQPPDVSDARDPESHYVFTSQRANWLRRQGKPDHLSPRGVEHLWLKLKQQAPHDMWDLIHDVRFHDLRHDWAHRARSAGWSLEEIAVYAGHQTKDGAPAINTTARYTLPGRQQIRAQLQNLSG